MEAETPIRWRILDAAEHRQLRVAADLVFSGYDWIKAAYLYGSAAQVGRAARDIDIGLVANPVPAGWGVELRIAEELALASAMDAGDFDVRVLNEGSPIFLGNVLSGGILIYEGDRETRLRFEVQAMSRYLDFAPVWKNLRSQVLQRWSDE